MLNKAKSGTIIISCLLLTGCQFSKHKIVPDDPNFAPVAPQKLVAPPVNNGSLYREGFGLSLYDDNTARRIGDILTVQFTEDFESSTDTTTNSSKSATVSSPNPTILGGTISGLSVPGALHLRNRGESAAVSIDTNNSYTGGGDSEDKVSLDKGVITVTVSEVFPNGNLRIRGEKWIMLNQDEKYIRLSGIVRPEDIDQHNVIPSTKIADSRISYGGKGLVSESAVPGWITRFFLSPLWPF